MVILGGGHVPTQNAFFDEIGLRSALQGWDGIVMCYLPGSEGQGVANVLCGGAKFTGTLPSPWYSDLKQIGTKDCWLKQGYGLKY